MLSGFPGRPCPRESPLLQAALTSSAPPPEPSCLISGCYFGILLFTVGGSAEAFLKIHAHRVGRKEGEG